MTKENDNLDFDKAKDLTVGEAVRKDAEIKAGITDEDSILDKYIKQHPDEVASQKFETREVNLEDLDTATLDDFIKKQRAEVEHDSIDSESDLAASEVNADMETTAAVMSSSDLGDNNADEQAAVASISAEPEDDSILKDSSDLDDKPFYKRKVPILVGLLLLLLSVFGISYGVNQFNKKEAASSPSTASSSSRKALDASGKHATAQSIKDNEAFGEMYDGFFTDDKAVKLKNSEFGKLPELEIALKKLEGTKFYDAAKEKYDNLKEQIDGIQAVNAKFDKAVIVDGELVDSAKPKADANFDDLSVGTLNTGNASLDNLLQKAVKKGRDELKGVKDSSAAEAEASRQSSVAASESASKAAEEEAAAASRTESQAAAPSQNNQEAAPAAPVAPSYGISGYDAASLQRNLSRVPYNEAAIADSGNAAWNFAPGVLETVVGKAQARGNISGNNYILERVNIVNGNGYYNMFKPDGTYLFSINAKTGYFVGNKPGNADNLDY
ncbi:cell division site-positioning protein MapZ family protein [Streptococcus halotolerans]|uniref:cell division site-positioning protein MapZ family protein n=1 Tax=Streptococcus halotolerans TaxID=1814128 RepID=UPI0007886F2D|nr:cell division site-positioning protein MapZ family protein [Streptococcus halotolerans]